MKVTSDKVLVSAINDSKPVSGLSHTFYKYPARFSPVFVREVVARMTEPGDVVLDPFVGGGTALVESMAAGRSAIGLDINQLAIFVARVKTTRFTERELENASGRVKEMSALPLDPCKINLDRYALNMADRFTWRLRNFLALCIEVVQSVESRRERAFVRCVLLRTAQWGLDCKRDIPTLKQFREKLVLHGEEAIAGAREFRRSVSSMAPKGGYPRVLCLLRSAIGAENDDHVIQIGQPKLVITSPPYPGVHVLYHRWQVNGRRETAAPYWIANLEDGEGASYYTFADRNRSDLGKYLEAAKHAFSSVRRLVASGTPLVQMVAFSQPDDQLILYLEMLREAGWCEMRGTVDRLWRTVPGRKWYTSVVASRANRELVLFHVAQ